MFIPSKPWNINVQPLHAIAKVCKSNKNKKGKTGGVRGGGGHIEFKVYSKGFSTRLTFSPLQKAVFSDTILKSALLFQKEQFLFSNPNCLQKTSSEEFILFRTLNLFCFGCKWRFKACSIFNFYFAEKKRKTAFSKDANGYNSLTSRTSTTPC